MELLLCLVVVLVLCIVLGVSAELIAAGAIVLASLFCIVFIMLFLYSGVRLVVSRKCTAEFVRIDKSPKGGFNTAYYRIDGAEYPNAFPCEVVFRKRLYRTGKSCEVYLDRKKGKTYDKNAVLTCVIGCGVSLFLGFGIAIIAQTAIDLYM